jgi:hypothetical protein
MRVARKSTAGIRIGIGAAGMTSYYPGRDGAGRWSWRFNLRNNWALAATMMGKD